MFRPGPETRLLLRAAAGRTLVALACATAAFAVPQVHAAGQPLATAKIADLKGEDASSDVRHIADWAVHSGDHGGLPFAIVDKLDGRVYVFDATGRLRGASPALVGSARGDTTVPGIGTRPISSIQPDERTTPAGRFDAVPGRNHTGEHVVWVDYESAFAIHRLRPGFSYGPRASRLAHGEAAGMRVSWGCVVVPVTFYRDVVEQVLGEGRSVVYVLPETRPAQALFTALESS